MNENIILIIIALILWAELASLTKNKLVHIIEFIVIFIVFFVMTIINIWAGIIILIIVSVFVEIITYTPAPGYSTSSWDSGDNRSPEERRHDEIMERLESIEWGLRDR